MDGYYVGLFAVPADEIAGLLQLHARSASEPYEDPALRCHRVYRRACEVALARRVLRGWDAFVASGGVMTQLKPLPVGETIHAPKSCAELERGISDAVDRAGGDAAFVADVVRSYPDSYSLPEVAGLCEALREILHVARQQRAGFVWVECEPPGAAERFAVRIREIKERGDLMTVAEQSASSENLGAAWLCVVTDDVARDYVAAIAAARAWDSDEEEDDADNYDVEDDADDYDVEDDHEDSADDDDDYDSDGDDDDDVEPDPYTLANLNIYQHAIKHAELRKHNEVTAIEGLDDLLPTIAPEIHQSSGAYTAAQAAQLLPAVLRWEADNGGEDATVELLLDRVFGYKTHVRRAYRAFKRILTAAVKTKRAFVWFTSDAFRVVRGLSRLSE